MPKKLRIFCPLAGDDPFVHCAWSHGHDVTALDIVPDALDVMRATFGVDASDWSSSSFSTAAVTAADALTGVGRDDGDDDGGTNAAVNIWKHKSGRATLIESDVLTNMPELAKSFDVVYDKDSFGALSLDDRSEYCMRISEYLRDGGVLYVEVVNKDAGRDSGGPPYHVEEEDLMLPCNFGMHFEYVCYLGEVYPLNMDGMTQTGHVLKRVRVEGIKSETQAKKS